jgi:hypothetical protein
MVNLRNRGTIALICLLLRDRYFALIHNRSVILCIVQWQAHEPVRESIGTSEAKQVILRSAV